MSKTASLGGILSTDTPAEKPFIGNLKFRKRTISFSGTTLLLENVAKYELYGVTKHYKVSTMLYIISILISIASLIFFLMGGFITLIIFGLTAYNGYKERNRPNKLFGLTIELNSGTKHNFLSVDKDGVDRLFKAISDAVEENRPLLQSFNFQGDTITGDKYEFNHSEIGSVGLE